MQEHTINDKNGKVTDVKTTFNTPLDQYRLVATMQKPSPQMITVPTPAFDIRGGVNRQVSAPCSSISNGGLNMNNIKQRSFLKSEQKGDRVLGCCHLPEYLLKRKERGFDGSKSHHMLVYLQGKDKCLDSSVSAFSSLNKLLISLSQYALYSNSGSGPTFK